MKPQSRDISIVIPTYNRSEWVGNAIESVLSQTAQPGEIIVVDDGSSDDTGQVVSEFSEHVRYVRQDNGGVSVARNTGLEESTGAFVAFLDDDDVYESTALEMHLATFADNPEAVCSVKNANMIAQDGTRQILLEILGEKRQGQWVDPNGISAVLRGGLFLQCMLFRKWALNAGGSFDTSMLYEDLDVMSRVAPQGPWAFDSRVGVNIIRREGDSISASYHRNPIHAAQSLLKIYERLDGSSDLSSDQKKVTKEKIASNLLLLAGELLESGRKGEAEEKLRACLRTAGTAKQRIRALGMLCPVPSVSRAFSPHKRKRVR